VFVCLSMSALKGVAVLFNLYYVVMVKRRRGWKWCIVQIATAEKGSACGCIFFNNVRVNLRLFCSRDDAKVMWKLSDQIRSTYR